MTLARIELLTALNLLDTWQERRVSALNSAFQGWNCNHRFLLAAVAKFESLWVVDMGLGNGASVATMAHEIKRLWSDGVVIAADISCDRHEYNLNLDFWG